MGGRGLKVECQSRQAVVRKNRFIDKIGVGTYDFAQVYELFCEQTQATTHGTKIGRESLKVEQLTQEYHGKELKYQALLRFYQDVNGELSGHQE